MAFWFFFLFFFSPKSLIMIPEFFLLSIAPNATDCVLFFKIHAKKFTPENDQESCLTRLHSGFICFLQYTNHQTIMQQSSELEVFYTLTHLPSFLFDFLCQALSAHLAMCKFQVISCRTRSWIFTFNKNNHKIVHRVDPNATPFSYFILSKSQKQI